MDANIKDILNRPFERQLIKERVGPGGRMLSYVSVGHYIARLNEAFEGDWSYEITETKLLDDEAIVHVRLSAGGMTKMGIGGASITRRRDNGKPVSIAHDVMAAEASSLKRAARLLGIGAALYLDEDDAPAPAHTPGSTRDSVRHEERQGASGGGAPPPGGSPRITNAQIGKLRSLVAESGSDWGTFRTSVRQQHGVNVEYADRALASALISQMLDPKHRSNGGGNAHGSGNGNGHGHDWRRR